MDRTRIQVLTDSKLADSCPPSTTKACQPLALGSRCPSKRAGKIFGHSCWQSGWKGIKGLLDELCARWRYPMLDVLVRSPSEEFVLNNILGCLIHLRMNALRWGRVQQIPQNFIVCWDVRIHQVVAEHLFVYRGMGALLRQASAPKKVDSYTRLVLR
jgi:hypothetical protein